MIYAAKKAYGRLAAADGTNNDGESGQSESAGDANQSRSDAHRLIGKLLGVGVYEPHPCSLTSMVGVRLNFHTVASKLPGIVGWLAPRWSYDGYGPADTHKSMKAFP